ncbi:prephenate dehydrogenase [Thiosulfatihalobacter marinus]|uniref:prephenate dehydrogenase n=1 Tax=Thiosulfatihalobacter marinus TaxID=2792481 RepID=UPI0018D880DD|nr:prephenate dehydrogenase [Thiosulfatihalobacter marinus]
MEGRKLRSLGLFGFGAFGKLVAREMGAHFDITVCDPTYIGAVLEDGRAFAMGDIEDVAGCNIVVLAVPVARMAHLCACMAPHLRPGTLVVDVGSVKLAPMRAMATHLPEHVEIVGTHPLFGPQSAASGIAGRKIALCPLRGNRWRRVARFLRRLGLEVIVTSAEDHDREAAMVQGLTHLIAKVLVEMGPLPERMTTASFDLLREAVGMVKDDPPTVLHAIETANPFAAEVRGAFFERAERVRKQFEREG